MHMQTLAVAHLHEIPVYNTQCMNYQVFGLWDLLPWIFKMVDDGRDTPPPAPPSDHAMLSIKASLHRKLRATVADALGISHPQCLIPFLVSSSNPSPSLSPCTLWICSARNIFIRFHLLFSSLSFPSPSKSHDLCIQP